MTKNKPHTGHEDHICAMVEDGLTKDAKKLMKKAEFVCSCCSRVAVNAENLCCPEPL